MRAVFYFMSINIVEDVVQISRETGGISINSLLVSIINYTLHNS